MGVDQTAWTRFQRIAQPLVLFVTPVLLGPIVAPSVDRAVVVVAGVVIGLLLLWIYFYLESRFGSLDDLLSKLHEGLLPDGGDHMTWQQFFEDIEKLRLSLKTNPDIVVSVGRAGSVVGAIIASNLGSTAHIAVDRLHVEHKGQISKTTKEISDHVKLNPLALRDKSVLVVMAECTTGETLKAMDEYLRRLGQDGELGQFNYKAAVLYCKTRVSRRPDICLTLTDEPWKKLPHRRKWRANHPQREE